MSDTLMLIDLPYIAHSLFHANGAETQPKQVATQIAVKVRQLAEHHPHAAICCDGAKSFRRELDTTYKAQRDTEHRAAVQHILELACAALKADGFPVWCVEGFEADDAIATATARALACGDDTRVLIASSDKDLLQLVSDRVTVQSLRDDKGMLTTNGRQMTPADVREKFGVEPSQMVDWLCLVGDNSDNIKGADGIGAKRATELLKTHGSVDALYAALANGQPKGMTPTMRTSLMEFRDRTRSDETSTMMVGLAHVRNLITLRTDAPIPFEEIVAERTKPMSDYTERESRELEAHLNDPETASMRNEQSPERPKLTPSPIGDAIESQVRRITETMPHVPVPTPAALVRRASVAIEPVIDVPQALARMQRLQDFCARYLEESTDGGTDGGDYGVIPGAGKKKVLLKSGADKLCDVYALADTYLILTRTEDWDTGLFAYDIECRLSSRVDDSLVGSGLGSCSSFESKYRYRAAGRKCPKCEKSDAIIKGKAEYGGGWICFGKKGGCGAKFKDGDKAIEGQSVDRVENPDIIDSRNTVLKMAKKRAKIDAVIGVTRSSGIFTQDLED